ncbi:MAG: hypothetical protein HQK50_09460, partial [Oligoflexia bacterium]|nr:hypothetical protein [Oligoflexia bacterium]
KFSEHKIDLDYNFSHGIPSAEVTAPWADSFWATYQGGIANRYQYGNINGVVPSKAELQQNSLKKLQTLPTEELQKLSPAEKYDIYCCNYNYPLTNSEIKRTYATHQHPTEQNKWTGLCHGWAPASIHFQEPDCTTLSNKDGIQVPFNSTDVKALLDYFQGQGCKENTCTVGARCKDDPKHIRNWDAYLDVNPGTMHVVLTNLLGRGKQALAFDKDPAKEVWNQPLYGYSFQVLSEDNNPTYKHRARGTAKEVSVRLNLKWVDDLDEDEIGGDHPYANTERVKKYLLNTDYEYILELDAKGNILGGRWIGKSINDHPDFIWLKQKGVFSKSSFWKPLETIYESSIKKQ